METLFYAYQISSCDILPKALVMQEKYLCSQAEKMIMIQILDVM